ncbi:MAG: LruC domain-containing protein [Thiohalocapsa sp.]|jgi:LruC domain-containing protein
MDTRTCFLTAVMLAVTGTAGAQESIRLTDVVKSTGTGKIDFFKDVDAAQLEQLRLDNGGVIVVGVDVNESASGTEKSSTQAVTLGTLTLTVTYNDGREIVYDLADGCCETETQALLAEAPDTDRLLRYTLLGESGSSRITSNNTIQNDFDSTIKIRVDSTLYDPAQGIEATSVVADIAWLNTNTDLGDPEAFYDFTNGFEDLALLNATDTAFIDAYDAGEDEAVAVILTDPPVETDPLAVATWNYFPSASSYYLVGYEDLYPTKGDYDFNDLTVAYQVRYGLNGDGAVVTLRGTAYLITRGAGYSHDWKLRIPLPGDATAVLTCTTFLDPGDEYSLQDCSPAGGGFTTGSLDIQVFSATADIFPDPGGAAFTNTLRDQAYVRGPKSVFRVDLDAPLPASSIGEAPFDPYLFVRNTGEEIQLLQVNPDFRDQDGFPFGMLMPIDWLPPLEFFSISTIYPLFDSFVGSEATQYLDWYDTYLPDYVVPVPAVNVWGW